MDYKNINIKDGITLHEINTDKFKTNLIAVFLTTKLKRENVTKNALIPAILRRGTKKLKTQEEISKRLEEMYGAEFDCGLDKTGDNQVLKFYIETINDNFLPENDSNLLEEAIKNIFDIVFNPYVENNGFKEDYLNQEKNNIRQIIEGKIDNKARYALDRCIEEMYKNQNFGLYRFGYVEDLEKITANELYEYYKELISNCKIDIFVSGIIDDKLEQIVRENENIDKANSREAQYNLIKLEKKENVQIKTIVDNMDVTQGKLILGLDVNINDDELSYTVSLYNSILGGSANSKLFQNVREKANLAYIASSSYLRYKSNIFIKCGIEIDNYEKALNIIKEQLEDMKKGNFTDEDIENSKKGILAGIKTIDDEQDTQITFFFGHEVTGQKTTIEEYSEKIKKVSKQDIIDVANLININTIYFLRD
ncbi:MAG: insulinase family protein [Clostridia bacterium]|nr:insulinase family protein [Clostridia bacterium]